MSKLLHLHQKVRAKHVSCSVSGMTEMKLPWASGMCIYITWAIHYFRKGSYLPTGNSDLRIANPNIYTQDICWEISKQRKRQMAYVKYAFKYTLPSLPYSKHQYNMTSPPPSSLTKDHWVTVIYKSRSEYMENTRPSSYHLNLKLNSLPYWE